jgi:hypothetical protein
MPLKSNINLLLRGQSGSQTAREKTASSRYSKTFCDRLKVATAYVRPTVITGLLKTANSYLHQPLLPALSGTVNSYLHRAAFPTLLKLALLTPQTGTTTGSINPGPPAPNSASGITPRPAQPLTPSAPGSNVRQSTGGGQPNRLLHRLVHSSRR